MSDKFKTVLKYSHHNNSCETILILHGVKLFKVSVDFIDSTVNDEIKTTASYKTFTPSSPSILHFDGFLVTKWTSKCIDNDGHKDTYTGHFTTDL